MVRCFWSYDLTAFREQVRLSLSVLPPVAYSPIFVFRPVKDGTAAFRRRVFPSTWWKNQLTVARPV